MTAYYNEIDPDAAQWLRNLIEAGHIADGVVDTRSISEVEPNDLHEFTQCHFFAGIGVWSFALRLAGWPDDRPVWTGSCPCQPFSSAGRADGFADERHLWPHAHHLIRECRPAIIFGEQVASKAVEPWIDLVQTDLEGLGYAFAGIPFPSAGVGAPHIRDRLFWVGHTDQPGPQGHTRHGGAAGRQGSGGSATEAGVSGRAADSDSEQHHGGRGIRAARGIEYTDGSAAGGLADPESGGRGQKQQNSRGGDAGTGPGQTVMHPGGGDTSGLAHTSGNGRDQRGQRVSQARSDGVVGDHGVLEGQPAPGPTNGFWRDSDWLFCRDGKWRPVEPGTFPLAHGAPARVVRLRAYGNAINAEAAKEFIEAYLDLEAVGGLV